MGALLGKPSGPTYQAKMSQSSPYLIESRRGREFRHLSSRRIRMLSCGDISQAIDGLIISVASTLTLQEEDSVDNLHEKMRMLLSSRLTIENLKFALSQNTLSADDVDTIWGPYWRATRLMYGVLTMAKIQQELQNTSNAAQRPTPLSTRWALRREPTSAAQHSPGLAFQGGLH